MILDQSYAYDFMRFCQLNPKACPLVGVTDTGSPYLHTLGTDIDIRTDVPSYYIYRNGLLDETATDISTLWNDKMVGFAIGCSFTFEHALIRAGIPIWHMDNDSTVPMFKTNIETIEAGPFAGPMVVSMRAIPIKKLEMVCSISANFPMAHGAPVHWGDPAAIGIADLNEPDWGDPSPVGDEEIAVFWACGVTPQAAIINAKPAISITQARPNADYRYCRRCPYQLRTQASKQNSGGAGRGNPFGGGFRTRHALAAMQSHLVQS